MRERPGGGEEAMDLEVLARDDALLDMLGRGEAAPGGDELAGLLAAWRADVADGTPEEAVVRPPAPSGEPAEPTPLAARPAARARRHRPWAVRLAAAAVALLVVASGLGIGSRNAEPGSPLWSLTRLLYPQRAEVRDVEATIAQARAALAGGRLSEAQQLVDRARGDLGRVSDPAAAARLRAELDALARELTAARSELMPTAVPSSAAPGGRPTAGAAAPSTAAPAPEPGPSRSPTSASSPAAPSGAASESNRPLLPLPLPELPLPPLPLPSLSPLLPGLPLPTLL